MMRSHNHMPSNAKVRQTGLQLVVATVHMDVVAHLQPNWLFCSDYAELITFSGSCDRQHLSV